MKLPARSALLCCALAVSSSHLWCAQAPDEKQAVAALIAKMTLEEKATQMQNRAPAIPRLGIAAYDWWSEGLHGSARSGYSTLFPQAIGMAATWDTELLREIGDAISVEARAKYNQAVREGNYGINYGLTIWSPNINIFRDPRWGRGQETYGEDPFLTGRLGVNFVRGIQGDDPDHPRAIATPKHFAVHSGPESSRHKFNVAVSPHDLEDTYLPAFRATVTEAHAQSVMCAYNAVDGEPACANHMLLADTLRRDWGFRGFVTSDCGAVSDVAEGHRFSPDIEHAAVVSLRAGTDTSCGSEYATLVRAVSDGLLKENELDLSLQRLFLARLHLGMFDPESAYNRISMDQVDSEQHRLLALKAARESIVLLKNQEGALPLKPGIKKIAVIGPNAASLAAIEGNYNAIPSHPVMPLDGVRAIFSGAEIGYSQGAPYVDGVALPAPETLFHPERRSSEAGLHAEYFAGQDFARPPVVVRTDRRIDFDWNAASPAPGVLATDFGVRWTGTITAPKAGDYLFNTSSVDCSPCGKNSYAVYLDGVKVAEGRADDSAGSHPRADPPFHLVFHDTQPHAFRMEYLHASPRFGGGVTLNWKPESDLLRQEAVRVAQQADVILAFVGLSPDLEGEEMPVKVEGFAGGDRTAVELPAVQQRMLEAVAATGKPLVVVLMNGSAVAVNWAQQHAAAVLEAWYPGEQGGTAIAETLSGTNNPAGRLPVTVYASTGQLPAFDDYSMKGRTYRYLRSAPLYPFGYGLSYSRFQYSQAALSSETVAAGGDLTVSATVTNSGAAAGDEVVEVYLTPPSSPTAPIHALVGFRRIHLDQGEMQQVTIPIAARQLSQVDAEGRRVISSGTYKINIGGSQPDPSDPGLKLLITGSQAMPR